MIDSMGNSDSEGCANPDVVCKLALGTCQGDVVSEGQGGCYLLSCDGG